MLEKELLLKIEENAIELAAARRVVSKLKSELVHAETDVVSLKINEDKYKEQLRVLQARTIKYELSDKDKDIERFKQALPEIMEKLK